MLSNLGNRLSNRFALRGDAGRSRRRGGGHGAGGAAAARPGRWRMRAQRSLAGEAAQAGRRWLTLLLQRSDAAALVGAMEQVKTVRLAR